MSEASGPALARERVITCILAVPALIVGVWYAAYGFSLLMFLPQVTRRWILMSGDPDFIHDYEWFLSAFAVLAAVAALLGITSLRLAARTLKDEHAAPRRWVWLVAGAALVGAMRTFVEMSAGLLTPWRLASFTAVCVLYALLWAFDRPAPGVPRARTA